jgi:hypothetical protein
MVTDGGQVVVALGVQVDGASVVVVVPKVTVVVVVGATVVVVVSTDEVVVVPDGATVVVVLSWGCSALVTGPEPVAAKAVPATARVTPAIIGTNPFLGKRISSTPCLALHPLQRPRGSRVTGLSTAPTAPRSPTRRRLGRR